jgi:hypothetical protein
MRLAPAAIAFAFALAFAGCGAPSAVSPPPRTTPGPKLPDALEHELRAIEADPQGSVGYGEKAFTPYEPNEAHFLISYDDPAVTQRLLAEMDRADRVKKLALLQVIGKRTDPTVDAALLSALEDPELRATSAYLLGRPGFKGYPARERDVDAVRDALWRHLDDPGTFEDPFYRQAFRTQDFVLAAYVRLTGPDRFRFGDSKVADMIGYTLPAFDDATRADLVEQARALR